MVFGQEKLLTSEQEKTFKPKLKKLRDAGLTAKQIAEELRFGVEGTLYARLKLAHVYFYVDKFQLKRKVKRKVKDNINEKFKNLYFKYRKGMPEEIAENLRDEGFLLNDPLGEDK